MNKYIILLLIGFQLGLNACGPKRSNSTDSSSTAPQYKAAPYCNTAKSIADSLILSGSATYQYRIVTTNGLGAGSNPTPIRFAEVWVLNGNNEIVQCGETDGSGNYSLQIPKVAGNYTVQVNSRAQNSHVNVFILTDINTDMYHFINKSFTLTGTENSLTLDPMNAPYNGTLEGGAFNIFDQILKANEFIHNNSGTCSGCSQFTVAPLVFVYWQKGFNPGSLYGIDPLSFYDSTDGKLYILGGKNGDVNYVDTDHFDNSVIVHEYAHFLEDTYSVPNSPGGSHNGNNVVDPRLAWGEGWASFLQGAVTDSHYYIDTQGNIDGQTQLFVIRDLQTPDKDIATLLGEGNFREFSVSRVLYKLLNRGINFSYFWNTLTNNSIGFKSSEKHFRNIGLFHEIFFNQLNSANHPLYSPALTIVSGENQVPDQRDYTTVLSAKSSCTNNKPYSIRGVAEYKQSVYDTEFDISNQFSSNDFYSINHPGGAFKLELNYDVVNPITDLDLFLYNEDYVYGDSTTMIYSSRNHTDNGYEKIELSNLAAGYYLIDIKVYTTKGIGASTNYGLSYNGGLLCQ